MTPLLLLVIAAAFFYAPRWAIRTIRADDARLAAETTAEWAQWHQIQNDPVLEARLKTRTKMYPHTDMEAA